MTLQTIDAACRLRADFYFFFDPIEPRRIPKATLFYRTPFVRANARVSATACRSALYLYRVPLSPPSQPFENVNPSPLPILDTRENVERRKTQNRQRSQRTPSVSQSGPVTATARTRLRRPTPFKRSPNTTRFRHDYRNNYYCMSYQRRGFVGARKKSRSGWTGLPSRVTRPFPVSEIRANDLPGNVGIRSRPVDMRPHTTVNVGRQSNRFYTPISRVLPSIRCNVPPPRLCGDVLNCAQNIRNEMTLRDRQTSVSNYFGEIKISLFLLPFSYWRKIENIYGISDNNRAQFFFFFFYPFLACTPVNFYSLDTWSRNNGKN